MLLLPFNQNDTEKNLFGLRPARLVWVGGGEQPKGIEKRETITLAELKERVENAKKALEANKKEVTEKTNKYNAAYASADYFKWNATEKKNRPQEQPLKLDFNALDKPFDADKGVGGTMEQIKALQKAEFYYDGKWYRFDQFSASDKRKNQANDAAEILRGLEKHIERTKALEKAIENERKGHGYLLVRKSRRIEEMTEVRTGFEKKKPYLELKGDYDEAVTGLLSDSEFKEFYERPDGTIDPYLKRETEQLFFSILAHDTENFDTDFVLRGFTENPEENKKNFPFIYHEWVEKKGSATQEVKEAERAAKNKENELAVKKVPSIETVVTSLNQAISGSPAISNRISAFKNPVEAIERKVQDSVYFDKKADVLTKFQRELEFVVDKLDMNNSTEKAFAKTLREKIEKEIEPHIELAKLQAAWKRHEEKVKNLESDFTKSNLEKATNRQIIIELAMKKFKKAMLMIDRPFGKAGGTLHRNFHPGVRRLLIATAYYEGVSRYVPDWKNDGEEKFIENTSEEYRWLLAKMTQSPYFNRGVKDRFLDPEQRNFLIIGRYANLALLNSKHAERILKQLNTKEYQNALKRLEVNLKKTGTERTAAQTEINKDLQTMRLINPNLTEANVLQAVTIQEGYVKSWKAFAEEAEKLMAKPDREAIGQYIEKLKNSSSVDLDDTTKKKIEAFARFAEAVDVNYNSMEFQEKNRGQYLERMGINAEAVYEAYKNFLKKNPEMTLDQWDNQLLTKEGTAKLVEMFREILPDSRIYKGKESFLKIMETLQGLNPLGTEPEIRDEQAVALNLYSMIKMEMRHREAVEAATREGNDQAIARLEGMTFGDKITDYAKGVINMLIGPGQSIANRAAGAAMLLLAWKAAKKAYNGEGKLGKMLRVLFVAGAAELTLKHVTGEGMLDRLKVANIADDLDGTYESVLLHRAETTDLKIKETEHARALLQMRDVPFSQLMEWYEKTDINGHPYEGQRDIFPKQIDEEIILPGEKRKWSEEQKSKRARFIIKRTMENFFGYVGGKEQKDATHGKDILKEIYVEAVQKKDFNLAASKYATRHLPEELLNQFRQSPRLLTWQRVMQSEIFTEDVTRAQKSKVTERMKDYIQEGANELARWGRQDILQPTGVAAQEFWSNVSENYAPKAKQWLIEMGEAGATKLRYGAHSVELWYEGNKHTLRKVGRETWELVVEGVKLPFHLLYGGHQLLVPWAATKLRQTREILRSDKLVTINGPLQASNIMRGDAIDKFMKGEMKLDELFKPSKHNPEARYFGLYQMPFLKAFNNFGGETDRYYESRAEFNEQPHVGYYISETNQEDAGVKKGIDSMEDNFNKMQAKSWEQAKDFYMGKGASLEDVKKYMYPIHAVSQNAEAGGETPARLYVFWRMPLRQSEEYQLKELGRWTDYMDPNGHKFEPPFRLDPSKGILENLQAAYGLDSPVLRKGADVALIAAAQWLRMVFGLVKGLGRVTGGAIDLARKNRDKGKNLEWLYDLTRRDEGTLQKIDEYLGSAAHSQFALSEFYKNKDNAKLYKEAVEAARASRPAKDLDLSQLNRLGKKVDVEEWSERQRRFVTKRGVGHLSDLYNTSVQ